MGTSIKAGWWGSFTTGQVQDCGTVGPGGSDAWWRPIAAAIGVQRPPYVWAREQHTVTCLTNGVVLQEAWLGDIMFHYTVWGAAVMFGAPPSGVEQCNRCSTGTESSWSHPRIVMSPRVTGLP